VALSFIGDCYDITTEWRGRRAISLKQQSVDKHVVPDGHITLIIDE
jgi:hypothetical protein